MNESESRTQPLSFKDALIGDHNRTAKEVDFVDIAIEDSDFQVSKEYGLHALLFSAKIYSMWKPIG